jgi:hypothetical protein
LIIITHITVHSCFNFSSVSDIYKAAKNYSLSVLNFNLFWELLILKVIQVWILIYLWNNLCQHCIKYEMSVLRGSVVHLTNISLHFQNVPNEPTLVKNFCLRQNKSLNLRTVFLDKIVLCCVVLCCVVLCCRYWTELKPNGLY